MGLVSPRPLVYGTVNQCPAWTTGHENWFSGYNIHAPVYLPHSCKHPHLPEMAPNKQATKKAAAVRTITVAPSAELVNDHLAFAASTIDPSVHGSDGRLAPSFTPTRVSTVVEKIETSYTGGTSFLAIARPSPYGTLSITDNTAVVENTRPVTIVAKIDSPSVTPTVTPAWTGTAYWLDSGGDSRSAGSVAAVAPVPATEYVIPYQSTLGGTATVQIVNASQTCSIAVNSYNNLGVLSTVTVRAPQGGTGSANLVVAANTEYISFTQNNASSSAVPLTFKCTIGVTGALIHRIVPDGRVLNLKTLGGIRGLRQYRIVSQSITVTFTGSDLQNGGKIAAAEVYAGWTPDPGQSPYDAIGLLPPDMSWSGAVKKGAHVFWRPSGLRDFDLQDYSVQEVPDFISTKRLYVAGTLDDPAASVRIRVHTCVQYMTDYPAYASSSFSRPFDGYDKVLLALAMMNPASENDSHLARIKALLSKKGKEAVLWAINHPAEVAAAASKFASILSG